MSNITIETDWGAKGAQLKGGQVQNWIKGELSALHSTTASLNSGLNSINARINDFMPFILASLCCRVVYIDKSQTLLKTVNYQDWHNLEVQGYKAMGVAIFPDGQMPRIVSLTGNALPWSRTNQSIATSSSTLENNYTSFNGEGKTREILNNSTLLFGDENRLNFAAGWCDNFEQTETRDGDICGLKDWYLPDMGELMLLSKYRSAINICLGVISGATALPEGQYWSSDVSGGSAWMLNIGNTEAGPRIRQASYYVRPMTKLYGDDYQLEY